VFQGSSFGHTYDFTGVHLKWLAQQVSLCRIKKLHKVHTLSIALLHAL